MVTSAVPPVRFQWKIMPGSRAWSALVSGDGPINAAVQVALGCCRRFCVRLRADTGDPGGERFIRRPSRRGEASGGRRETLLSAVSHRGAPPRSTALPSACHFPIERARILRLSVARPSCFPP